MTGLNLAPLAKRVVDLMQQVLPLATVRGGAGGFIFLLVPLGPAAIKQSEQEILGASIRFIETYRRSVLNPAIPPLSEGRIVPVRDTTGAHPVPNTMFYRSSAGQLYAPFEVLFFSGNMRTV